MARGDTEREIQRLAKQDGIELSKQSVPWINQRGHLGLPEVGDSEQQTERLQESRSALRRIFLELGGDETELAAGRPTRLPGDFIHELSGTLVEVDESQHFTSFRRISLEMYPDDHKLGFSLSEYKALCDEWSASSDGYFRSKSARCFGDGGRQRQRAYYDSLRDLASIAMGRPPTVRVAAADRDAGAAFRRERNRLIGQLPTFSV